MSGLSIAKSLEFPLLRPTVTHDDVRAGCELAREYHLAAVCVDPVHVARASKLLDGADTRVCAAIGFPYGQETIQSRLVAIEQAQADGAHEMAVMLDHSALVSGALPKVLHELERICASSFWSSLTNTKGHGQLTLVAETTLLDVGALGTLWQRLRESPVGFLQTSSGHQARAVTEAHVRGLRELLPPDVAIKAVGGVDSLADATALLSAGAVRVGTGSAIVIAQEERHERQERQVTSR